MPSDSQRHYTPVLAFLLLLAIVRFWLPLLSESFWLDETVTAFVLRHGANHPSLAASPHLDQTIYYWLPRLSQSILGFSEFSLRLPSLIATLISLFLTGRLAVRFIHPNAAWFTVFLLFIPREFTRQATDARPYGLGTCIALAGIFFLVRWLDRNRWREAAFFALFAALLIRVHLVYWPFYAVFAAYAILRLARRETPVSPRSAIVIFAAITASLIPLVPTTLALFRDAKSHIVVAPPTLNNILSGLQITTIAAAIAGLWLVSRLLRWPRESESPAQSTTLLLLSWWLWQPLCLLAASWITGNSVFVPRYFSLALPGAMLFCTLAAGRAIPAHAWKPLAALLAAGILLVSLWKEPIAPTRDSEWRDAAFTANQLVRHSTIPILCPSPFVEAQPPAWSPAYPLPGFLYAHLDAYPVRCTALLPARHSPEGDRYARTLLYSLVNTPRFVVYGGTYGVSLWTDWLARQPELASRNNHQVGLFGDVEIVMFEPAR